MSGYLFVLNTDKEENETKHIPSSIPVSSQDLIHAKFNSN